MVWGLVMGGLRNAEKRCGPPRSGRPAFARTAASARLFSNPVVPREWFLAPLDAIDDAVEKIREGTITRYRYDGTSASLVARQ